MIHFRCVNIHCGDLLHADERHGGRLVRCFRCGQATVCPTPSGERPARAANIRVWSWPKLGVCFAILYALLLLLGLLPEERKTPRSQPPQQVADGQGQPRPTEPSVSDKSGGDFVFVIPGSSTTPTSSLAGASIPLPTAASPAKAREREILRQNAGRLGDPVLDIDYQGINERHFGSSLPKIPVIWEPRLEEVGPLTAENFTLEGMWGRVDKQPFILLNPALSGNRRELERALCHEMVHEYLFTVGDKETNHGPAFAKELRRLSEEGAFEGILATEPEKAGLRAWLREESATLDSMKAQLERTGRDIDREREDLDKEVDELNARTTIANAQGYGWPSDDEVKSIKSRQDLFHQRLLDFNSLVATRNASATHFNREANRYNLMMSYPDGLDEESLIRPKSATAGPIRHWFQQRVVDSVGVPR